MAVRVKTTATARSLLGGNREVEAEGATVGELLDHLGIRDRLCDDSGQLRRHFNIHINSGEDVRLLQGLATAVHEGDTVTILSAVAGGGRISRRVWLTFPKELVDRPLIWEAGHRFDVVTNIRQASVSRETGIVGLEISGEADEVAKAIEFLSETGIEVEPVELGVVE